MGDDTVKTIVRFAFGGLVIASLIAATIEFARDQRSRVFGHRGEVGFIFMWLFFLIFAIVGIVAAVTENKIMAGVFVVAYSTLVLVDDVYLGAEYAFITGILACTAGAMYFVSCGGGGGGGK